MGLLLSTSTLAGVDIDLVRVCVIQFKAKAVSILLAQASLEAIVAAG